MPYCSNCGKEMQLGIKFCPECGAQAGAVGQIPQQVSTPPAKPQGTPRKVVVTGLSFLYLILGPIFIFIGVLLLLVAVKPAVAGLAATLGVAAAATGVLAVFSGYGLAKARAWVLWIGTISDIGLVVLGGILAIPLNSWTAGVGVLAVLLGVGSALYLFLGGTKAYLK